jgi:2'-5' RNA ligase
MTPYDPFIDDRAHIEALDRQRFVVLRAPFNVSAAFGHSQRAFRERLQGRPVSYPARAHVTLCGFAAGTPLQSVQELVRTWALKAMPLRIEIDRVSWFPPPFQIVIVEIRKTSALCSALVDLRAQAERRRLVVSTVVPVEQWRFHMSVAYCSGLGEAAWHEVVELAGTVGVPAVHDDVGVVEVVAFDDGREYSGGVYALGASATEARR